MLLFLLCVGLIHCGVGQHYQQNVAPGVPPQNYQQPPQQQGIHQPPPPPIQQQQQQFQQQQFQQQQPPQQFQQVDHGHHPDHVLNTANIAQEREHIQEHMDVPIDTSKMTDQELQFHYFKMHDTDNNNKLDGCELIKSLIHWHGHDGKMKQVPSYSDEQLQKLVDTGLKDADLNNDGFIDYTEFSTVKSNK